MSQLIEAGLHRRRNTSDTKHQLPLPARTTHNDERNVVCDLCATFKVDGDIWSESRPVATTEPFLYPNFAEQILEWLTGYSAAINTFA